MFFLLSSVLNSWPRLLAASSRSFNSLEMLSKKLELLLYAEGGMTISSLSPPFPWPLEIASAVGATEASPSGEPDAIASFTKSCLLNFALDDSKSKSVVGTSIFGACA